MMPKFTGQFAQTRTALSRATVLPFLIRCAVAVCNLIAMTVAWSWVLGAGQGFLTLTVIAVYPAVAPRGRGATFAALTVVTGWLAGTARDDAGVALWQVLTLSTMLYVGHSLTALAAQLPYDAMVNFDVPGGWLARTLAVVLVSAVLTVITLGITADLAGEAFLVATLVGLAGAVTATLLLSRLIRRPENVPDGT